MHYINVVPFVDKMLALVRPFMKKELYNMIQIHNDIDNLFEYVPRECLPKEHGGRAGSLKKLHEKQKKFLMECEDFFQYEERLLRETESSTDIVEQEENDESNRQGFLYKSMRFISFR